MNGENSVEMRIDWYDFPNIGYIYTKLPENVIASLRQEVDDIRSNFIEANKKIKFNSNLAGHIKKEYALSNTKEMLASVACSVAERYFTIYPNLKNQYQVLAPGATYDIDVTQPWVNFQQKYEYNPIHKHNGVLSFVIWLDIPYLIDEERAVFPDIATMNNSSGCFAFHYTDGLGKIATHVISVDKTYNGVMIMFPAELNHSVFPFYTSDDYRITISGNVHFK
jgi:hypothetical protein